MTDNRLLFLTMESSVACLNASVDDSWLSNKRFENLNFGSPFFMQKSNLVTCSPSFIELDNKICECCVIGKKHRYSFPYHHIRERDPLALVHVDIYGPK
jgi:hypothetical protein